MASDAPDAGEMPVAAEAAVEAPAADAAVEPAEAAAAASVPVTEEAATPATPSSSAADAAAAPVADAASASAAAGSVAASASAAASAAAAVPDSELTPEQLRARKMFDRWQKTFLGAIDKQSEEYVINMLREGEDLVNSGLVDLNRSIKPASGSTFLHTVAWFQKKRVIEWLLAHGADPNQGNMKGNTPLHLLSENANKEIAPQLIQLMIDYGGDVELKDGGDTPTSSVDKAKAVGFDVRQLSFEKHNAWIARRDGLVGGAEVPEAQVEPAATPAMSEAERAVAADKAKLVFRKLSTLFLGLEAEGVSQAVDDAIVRILTANLPLIHARVLEINTPPLAAEGNNKTFLHYAVIARRPEIVRVLLLALAASELDTQDESGDTPLHCAMARIADGNAGQGATIVSQLLEAGASVTIANYLKGRTPLQLVPTDISQELRTWLQTQISKPRQPKLQANTLASKFLSQQQVGLHAAGVGSIMPLPSPTGTGGAGAEKQDRASARAMMARMASSVNASMLSGGGAGTPTAAGGVGTPTSGPKSGALGLIQKGAGGAGPAAGALGLGHGRASQRSSGGPSMLSSAMAQIMAANRVAAAAGGAGAAGGKPVGKAVGPSSKKTAQERGIGGLDEVFGTLDLCEMNSVTPMQLLALHEEVHSCTSTCTLALVHQVLEGVVPVGQCTRANLLEVLSALSVVCSAQSALRWDFRLLDQGEVGALSTIDGTNGLAHSQAELIWQANQLDATTEPMQFQQFLTRKTKQERARPTEVRWNEMHQELTAKAQTS